MNSLSSTGTHMVGAVLLSRPLDLSSLEVLAATDTHLISQHNGFTRLQHEMPIDTPRASDIVISRELSKCYQPIKKVPHRAATRGVWRGRSCVTGSASCS
ncbi:hypothetical protein CBS147326_2834 [Penicillium roqueforti]|nr:hypothetical protein CBS147326_2834 [Penicillium roqueforti]